MTAKMRRRRGWRILRVGMIYKMNRILLGRHPYQGWLPHIGFVGIVGIVGIAAGVNASVG